MQPTPAQTCSPSTGPERTCIGCRARAPQAQLVRYTAQVEPGHTQVRADAVRGNAHRAERAAGRGAWLHPGQECLDRALKTRAFQRALRIPGHIAAELPTDGQHGVVRDAVSKAS